MLGCLEKLSLLPLQVIESSRVHCLGKGEIVSSILTGSTILVCAFIWLMFAWRPRAE
jgi:hypothetical protein